MVYCHKCGTKNSDDTQFCIKCGSKLYTKRGSFEKQVGDFAEEVQTLGKKAGKTIEAGVKNLGEEVKDIGKKVERSIQSKPSSTSSSKEYKKLYRSGKNRILAGVCAGVAEYFDIDPMIVRILWVIIVIFPPALGIILYILFWIFVPRNPSEVWD